MSNQQQLDENIRIFDSLTVGGLTDADKAFVKQIKETYLARVPIGCTGCRYCVPCPNDVKIPSVFHAYNENAMLGQDWKHSWNYGNMVKDGADASKCVGCGACVASCKNSAAMLFTSAKAAHLNLLPQGHPEKNKRVLAMVRQMDALGFGNCTNLYECEAACPKGISVDNIAKLNRDYMIACAAEAVGVFA